MPANASICNEDSPLLELKGVGKKFRSESGTTVAALGGIDLEVRRGEFVTLVGATGCGKTTLLNIIAGITEPDAGAGADERQDVAIGRNVAYVFQHYTLFSLANDPGKRGVRTRNAGRSAPAKEAPRLRTAGQSGPERIRARPAARAFRRHEAACRHRTGPRH